MLQERYSVHPVMSAAKECEGCSHCDQKVPTRLIHLRSRGVQDVEGAVECRYENERCCCVVEVLQIYGQTEKDLPITFDWLTTLAHPARPSCGSIRLNLFLHRSSHSTSSSPRLYILFTTRHSSLHDLLTHNGSPQDIRPRLPQLQW